MTRVVEVKTADLIGEPLNWAVARAEQKHCHLEPPAYGTPWRVFIHAQSLEECTRYKPSTDWAQGGPLIDSGITALNQSGTDTWLAQSEDRLGLGPNALIAACRAIVAAKLGSALLVPTVLLQGGAL